jgi:hypothetical protein
MKPQTKEAHGQKIQSMVGTSKRHWNIIGATSSTQQEKKNKEHENIVHGMVQAQVYHITYLNPSRHNHQGTQ